MKNYWEHGLINHRSSLGFWLNKYGLLGTMVEVGCAKGNFAREVLSQWEGKSYVMIDPWQAQDPEIYRETQTNEWDDWKHQCELLAKEDKRVELVQDYSPGAASRFKGGSLDIAFIDGNHSYRAVMEDLDAFWPKIKMGGILSGHDFGYQVEGGAFIEVDRAVERWAREHGVTFYVTPCTSFWIHKTTP